MLARACRFCFCLLWLHVARLSSLETGEFALLMPDVVPPQPETYFCTSVRLLDSQDRYIVGFRPNASMDTAHHMLVYGCENPGVASKGVWNCGDMAVEDTSKMTGPICQGHSQIIYAWAKNAPPLRLPEGVAFHVGKSSKVKYLTLQVHYADVSAFKDGSKTDDSGVFLQYTKDPQPRSAGVLLLGTGGLIMPNSVEYMETACDMDEEKTLHPFAFRVHTHSLGEVVSGWKVAENNGEHQWTLIGKMNPQLPQMFYPILNNITIRKGDVVAARCTMRNDRNRITRIGPTATDEMCNFYLMFWTDHGEPLRKSNCFSWGPPISYWHRLPMGFLRAIAYPWFSNIPSEEHASKISNEELRMYFQS